MKLYLEDKRISKKVAIELIGKEALEKFIKESKQDDPYTEHSIYTGMRTGMLSIEFETDSYY